MQFRMKYEHQRVCAEYNAWGKPEGTAQTHACGDSRVRTMDREQREQGGRRTKSNRAARMLLALVLVVLVLVVLLLCLTAPSLLQTPTTAAPH